MTNLSLLSTQSRVSVPFVKVTIGQYTFGVFNQTKKIKNASFDYYSYGVQYPNYIQSLEVSKINGQVNQYTLTLTYPITQDDDPNFFEKVFSSVSKTRKIVFTYGDLTAPSFIYREEEGMIMNVTQAFSMESSTITYTVSAVSVGILSKSGAYTFAGGSFKPSTRIKEILYDTTYGLTSVFTGMRDRGKVLLNKLIADDDQELSVDTKVNISPLDYILYLVTCMKPLPSSQSGVYTFTIYDDTTGEFQGSYFKVTKVPSVKSSVKGTTISSVSTNLPGAIYDLDIGVPNNKNIVTAFSIENNQSYSIFYDYTESLTTSEYVKRIDNNGNLIDIYAPIISSGNSEFKTNASTANWWKKVTQFPIKASITVKGLLRAAILTQYVRLKVYYYGRLHISSGLYIVTSQVDKIDTSGFTTTLSLQRVDADNTLWLQKQL